METAGHIERESLIFSPEMKMAELIGADYRLLTVLSRCGIGIGFGEKSVEEACAARNVDVNTFILICAMHSLVDYVPDITVLESVSAESVVTYLHSSHSSYIEGFTELEKSIQELVRPCAEMQKKVILKFFKDYKTEVENHFEYEEDILFPYVRSVISGQKARGYTISEFSEHHGNIEEKLDDLKNLILKYLPASCDCALACKVLTHLCSLAEDLDIHTSIENNVLVPVIAALEQDSPNTEKKETEL